MAEQPLPISQEERERRARSIASLRNSERMDGGDVSPFAAELFEQYVQGKLTLEEVGKRLKEHYGIQS